MGVRVADRYPGPSDPAHDIRAILAVEVDPELDPQRGRTYRIELRSGDGRTLCTTLQGAEVLVRELQHKLQVAASMEADDPGSPG